MPITDNLIAYWTLDEASGNNRIDSTGRGNDLFEDGPAVPNITGVIGNAMLSDWAVARALKANDNADLSVGAIDFTFSCWIYFTGDPGSDTTIFSKSAASEEEYDLTWNRASGKLKFGVCYTGYTGTDVFAVNTTPINTWLFVMCGHRNGSNIWIHVSGETEQTAAHTLGSQDTTDPFYIGRHHYNNFWAGNIDEVGFWKRDASGDYDALYNGGAGLAYPFVISGTDVTLAWLPHTHIVRGQTVRAVSSGMTPPDH